MKAEMIGFYLAGRGVKSLSRLRKFVADPDEIAAKIEAGAPVRQAITDACEEAGKQVRADRKRKAAWVAEYQAEIDELAHAPTLADSMDAAWSAYVQGMCDELAYSMEADVLDALEDDDDDDGVDEPEDDDDGDDEDDDEPKK